MSRVRFVDQTKFNAYKVTNATTATSASYATTASYADFATSASYAVSASHEIIKEISSSYADFATSASYAVTASHALNVTSPFTAAGISGSWQAQTSSMTVLSASYATTASFAQSGDGIFSGSFSGSYAGYGGNLTGISAGFWTGSNGTITREGDVQITGSLIISGSFNAFKLDTSAIILGNGAGENLAAGSVDNTFIGGDTGKATTTGDQNVLIGQGAGQTGNHSQDVSIGYLSGLGYTGGYNVSVGFKAGYGANLASAEKHNTQIGSQAGRNNWRGSGNTFIGYSAGHNGYDNEGCIIIGSGSIGGADLYAGGLTQQLRIGNGNDLVTISASLVTGDIIFPSTASAEYFVGDGSQLTGLPGGGLWSGSAANPRATGDVQITGSLIISGSFEARKIGTVTDTVVIGKDAGRDLLDQANDTNNSVIIGYQTAGGLVYGDDNTIIGGQAGYAMDANGQFNTFIGKGAGFAAECSRGLFIGLTAGYYVDGNGNIFLGDGTGTGNASTCTGTYNVGMGYISLYKFSTGDNNIALGYHAGYEITTGGSNIFIGSGSLGEAATEQQLRIGNGADIVTISASLATGDIIFPSTASAAYFSGDGSQLTNLPASSTFPFTGSALVSGSVDVTGSISIRSTLSGTQNLLEIRNNSAQALLQIGNTGIISIGVEADNVSHLSQVWGGAASCVGGYATVIGYGAAHTAGTRAVAIGASALAEETGAVAIGVGAQAGEHCIVLGRNIQNVGTIINSVVFSTIGGGDNTNYSTSNVFEWYNTHATNPNLRFIAGPASQSFWSGSGGYFGFGTTSPDAPLTVEGSGSTVFNVIGDSGTLFSVDDDLTGMLFTTNDISGLPVLQASASGELYFGKSPQSLYTTAVISATSASATASVYSLSTSSYDGVFFDYTITSASNARAGNIMSIWNGGSITHTETTTTDIGSTSGIAFDMIISQSQAQLVAVTDSTDPNTWKVKTIIRSI